MGLKSTGANLDGCESIVKSPGKIYHQDLRLRQTQIGCSQKTKKNDSNVDCRFAPDQQLFSFDLFSLLIVKWYFYNTKNTNSRFL
jgi:hypothetical protein